MEGQIILESKWDEVTQKTVSVGPNGEILSDEERSKLINDAFESMKEFKVEHKNRLVLHKYTPETVKPTCESPNNMSERKKGHLIYSVKRKGSDKIEYVLSQYPPQTVEPAFKIPNNMSERKKGHLIYPVKRKGSDKIEYVLSQYPPETVEPTCKSPNNMSEHKNEGFSVLKAVKNDDCGVTITAVNYPAETIWPLCESPNNMTIDDNCPINSDLRAPIDSELLTSLSEQESKTIN